MRELLELAEQKQNQLMEAAKRLQASKGLGADGAAGPRLSAAADLAAAGGSSVIGQSVPAQVVASDVLGSTANSVFGSGALQRQMASAVSTMSGHSNGSAVLCGTTSGHQFGSFTASAPTTVLRSMSGSCGSPSMLSPSASRTSLSGVGVAVGVRAGSPGAPPIVRAVSPTGLLSSTWSSGTVRRFACGPPSSGYEAAAVHGQAMPTLQQQYAPTSPTSMVAASRAAGALMVARASAPATLAQDRTVTYPAVGSGRCQGVPPGSSLVYSACGVNRSPRSSPGPPLPAAFAVQGSLPPYAQQVSRPPTHGVAVAPPPWAHPGNSSAPLLQGPGAAATERCSPGRMFSAPRLQAAMPPAAPQVSRSATASAPIGSAASLQQEDTDAASATSAPCTTSSALAENTVERRDVAASPPPPSPPILLRSEVAAPPAPAAPVPPSLSLSLSSGGPSAGVSTASTAALGPSASAVVSPKSKAGMHGWNSQANSPLEITSSKKVVAKAYVYLYQAPFTPSVKYSEGAEVFLLPAGWALLRSRGGMLVWLELFDDAALAELLAELAGASSAASSGTITPSRSRSSTGPRASSTPVGKRSAALALSFPDVMGNEPVQVELRGARAGPAESAVRLAAEDHLVLRAGGGNSLGLRAPLAANLDEVLKGWLSEWETAV